jgi:1,4-alpha-glucan branching enzyme
MAGKAMNDILDYLSEDPIFRKHHHGWSNSLVLTLPPFGIIVLRSGKESIRRAD